MKEFKINEFLTLKLEGGKTCFYVKNQLFNHCKCLLLYKSVESRSDLDEIESIDEVADIIKWKYYISSYRIQYNNIDPETEFWGHCSNMQVWAENDYDTRLLHRQLSFPLLKKLVDVGDPLAKKVFKEEIAKRFVRGYHNVITYLFEQNFLNYLNEEELRDLIKQNSERFDFSLIYLLDHIEKIRQEKYGTTKIGALYHRYGLKRWDSNLLDIEYDRENPEPSCSIWRMTEPLREGLRSNHAGYKKEAEMYLLKILNELHDLIKSGEEFKFKYRKYWKNRFKIIYILDFIFNRYEYQYKKKEKKYYLEEKFERDIVIRDILNLLRSINAHTLTSLIKLNTSLPRRYINLITKGKRNTI